MIRMESVDFRLGKNPHKLKHRWVDPIVWILSRIQQSHHCQICSRSESFVDGWLQIDDPENKDRQGCSVVCTGCEELNPAVFKWHD